MDHTRGPATIALFVLHGTDHDDNSLLPCTLIPEQFTPGAAQCRPETLLEVVRLLVTTKSS